jgi:hypothetical protein
VENPVTVLRSVRWPPTTPLLKPLAVFLLPGVNSCVELIPSPQAYARNGDCEKSLKWLDKKHSWIM